MPATYLNPSRSSCPISNSPSHIVTVPRGFQVSVCLVDNVSLRATWLFSITESVVFYFHDILQTLNDTWYIHDTYPCTYMSAKKNIYVYHLRHGLVHMYGEGLKVKIKMSVKIYTLGPLDLWDRWEQNPNENKDSDFSISPNSID